MSKAGKPDRRVQRTKRTLRSALVELILERGWEAVSVQDVCAKADVGRSTFYLHFADKEELLLSGFDDLRKALREQVAASQAVAQPEPLGFVLGLLEHAHENVRLGRAMFGRKGGPAVQKRFRDLMLELVREDLATLTPAGPQLEVAARFLTGAFMELLSWALDARSPPPAAQMAELYLQLARPALATLPGPAGRPRGPSPSPASGRGSG